MVEGTLVKLDSATVPAGGQAAIEFINISQAYDDLVIKVSARSSTAALNDNIQIDFNGSSANRSAREIFGTGSTAGSGTLTEIRGGYVTGNTATASTFGSCEIYIPNYRSSNNKSVSAEGVAEGNTTGMFMAIIAGLWSQTAAITSIKLYPAANAATWMQHSTATLYGVTRIPRGAKATGGVITDTDTHWIHTFTSSGVFTPSTNISNVDYLVVAGGGGAGGAETAFGGGGWYGGGGGAGGYRTTVGTSGGGASAESPLSLTASTNYTVTIGAGGVGGTAGGGRGNNGTAGSNSVFSTITSTGGGLGSGGGGSNQALNSGSGGSGGGVGATNLTTNGTAGTGQSGQGFAGNVPTRDGSGNAGGGGGAGGAGQYATATRTKGAGVESSITGSSLTRAEGGTGFFSANNVDGASNSGNGGDTANTFNGAGRNGGSGIVIVRYAK